MIDGLDEVVGSGGNADWILTPEGREFAAKHMGVIREAYGIDKIVEGIRVKFREREWLLVEEGDGVEVWSFEDTETITVLDEELVSQSYDAQGQLLQPSDAVCEWLALKLMAARDGQDHELTPAGLAMRKWLQVLPVDDHIKDGSCLDEFLSGDDINLHTGA